MSRTEKTARLLGEAGIKAKYKFDPSSSFKWQVSLSHPLFDYGKTREIAITQWGLNVAVRRTARRVIKAQRMQFRADQMTKAVTR